MKKVSYVILTALTAYALQSCNGSKSGSTTDSTISTKDSTTKVTTIADSTKLDSSDAKFAKNAAGGGMAEIELSKLAQTKSSSTKIKSFAAMMVKDHSAAGDSLTTIASKKGITLPTSLDADHQAKYDSLSKLSATDFNKGYINIMVADHQGALKLMQDEAQNGKDASLKAFATKVAPTVQMHLDAANKLQAGMK
jgi:putative membrane protein